MNILAFAPLPYAEEGVTTFGGGVAPYYHELLPQLAALGHDVRVIAEAPPWNPRLSSLPWSYPGLQVDWFGYEYLSSWQFPSAALQQRTRAVLTAKFAAALAERRPDLVVFGREVGAIYADELCAPYQLPWVIICHGVALAALADRRYPEDAAGALIAGLRSADLVIAIADHIERELIDLGVTRVCTIRNVVDAEVFKPASKDPDLRAELGIEDHSVVGHASFLGDVKRPLDIVRSAVQVLARRPETVYLILGEGPLRSRMQILAEELGVAAAFRFLGAVPREDMPRYLNLCDIVVLPSEREGLPLIGLEAQACGRALLASDIPASREIIADGETGVLFPLGDVDQLAANTLALLADDRRRAAIGARARSARVGESPIAWVGAFEAAFRKVLGSQLERHATIR